jgi:hypothetical protein
MASTTAPIAASRHGTQIGAGGGDEGIFTRTPLAFEAVYLAANTDTEGLFLMASNS